MKKILKHIFPITLLMGSLGMNSIMANANETSKNQTNTSQDNLKIYSVDSIDSRIEVGYKCGVNGKTPLKVMYGIKDNILVLAQAQYKGIVSPALYRVANSAPDEDLYVNGTGFIWSTQAATPKNITKAKGIALLQPNQIKTKEGDQQVSQFVTRECKVDTKFPSKIEKITVDKEDISEE